MRSILKNVLDTHLSRMWVLLNAWLFLLRSPCRIRDSCTLCGQNRWKHLDAKDFGELHGQERNSQESSIKMRPRCVGCATAVANALSRNVWRWFSGVEKFRQVLGEMV